MSGGGVLRQTARTALKRLVRAPPQQFWPAVVVIAVVATFSVQNATWFREYTIAVFVSVLGILYTMDVLDPTKNKTRAQLVLVFVALGSFFGGQLLQGYIEDAIGRLAVLQILGIVGIGTRLAVNYLVIMNEPLKRHRNESQPIVFDGNANTYVIYLTGMVAIGIPEVIENTGTVLGLSIDLLLGLLVCATCATVAYLLLGNEKIREQGSRL